MRVPPILLSTSSCYPSSTESCFADAARLFGEIFVQHNTRLALPECPAVHYISNEDKYPDGKRYIPVAGYHTDHSNDATPPKATVGARRSQTVESAFSWSVRIVAMTSGKSASAVSRASSVASFSASERRP